MASTTISIRLDAELKKQAETMFNDMGLNMTTATNLFLRQVVRQGRIPFEIATDLPNAETLAAMKEIDDMLNGKIQAKQYADTKKLFEDLDA